MHIILSPTRTDEILTAARDGDTLTLNGEDFDFSDLADGETLPADAVESEWITGDVGRTDGVLHITLRLPHGANAPKETRFPEPVINPPDGEIELPPHSIEVPEDEY